MNNEIMYGVSIFFGIIAGTMVNTGTHYILEWKESRQEVENFKFEIKLNIKKMDGFLEEVNKYRNAVNGEVLHTYPGYFNISSVVMITANKMFSNGSLYKNISHDEIEKLQVIFNEMSLPWENILSNEIMENKRNFNKAKAIMNVEFWEKKFKDHKKTFEDILKTIS